MNPEKSSAFTQVWLCWHGELEQGTNVSQLIPEKSSVHSHESVLQGLVLTTEFVVTSAVVVHYVKKLVWIGKALPRQ